MKLEFLQLFCFALGQKVRAAYDRIEETVMGILRTSYTMKIVKYE